MQDQNDRCLNGTEREQERILIKRLGIQKKKIELEIQLGFNKKEEIDLEIETKKKTLSDITERLEKGKKLVNGAKIKDVFPAPEPIKKVKENKVNKEEEKVAQKEEETLDCEPETKDKGGK